VDDIGCIGGLAAAAVLKNELVCGTAGAAGAGPALSKSKMFFGAPEVTGAATGGDT